MKFKKMLFLLTAVVWMTPSFVMASEPWPGGSGTIIADAVAESLGEGYEPSGAEWDEDGGTLFIVGDDGDLDELSSSGTVLSDWDPPGGDLEGVALNTGDDTDDYVYLGVEEPDAIQQFDTNSGTIVRSWDLTPWMQGDPRSGLEALTFVPNGEHPYADSASGGLFYAGLQLTGELFVFDVDTSTNGAVTHVDTIDSPIGSHDLAGLTYFNGVLYGAQDNDDELWTADTAGTLIETYSLLGGAEEGFALDTTCPGDTATAFITHDTGTVVRHLSFPVTCSPEDDGDSDGFDDEAYGGDDCDDGDNTIFPGATEIDDDGIDQDCDGVDGGGDDGNGGGENNGTNDETPSETVGAIVVHGNTVTIAMEDGVTVTRQPFSGNADVQAAITPGGERVVASNGKRVVVYRGTTEVRRKKMREKRLRHFSLGVRRFSNRNGQAIILAGRRGKKESVTIARLTENDRVTTVSRKQVYKKKNVRSFRIRKRQKARFVVYFGSTETRWRITPAGKLKRQSGGSN